HPASAADRYSAATDCDHERSARCLSESVLGCDHGSEHGLDQPAERPQRYPGHGLCGGHNPAVAGPDTAAGWYGDGGAGQYDPAERIDPAAASPVMTESVGATHGWWGGVVRRRPTAA